MSLHLLEIKKKYDAIKTGGNVGMNSVGYQRWRLILGIRNNYFIFSNTFK